MSKETLKKQEPIVYHALENACKESRISNAYLFYGPKGTPKMDAAILLAQSILCEKGDALACEECETCRRVKEGQYGDLIILDGSQDSISKNDVDAIQSQFSKTALEEGKGQKIYIIQNIENATISAQNSMLKFLEEPSAGVTAILITDNMNRILPTIVSRCTCIPFLPCSKDVYYDSALSLGINEEDAYFLANIAKDENSMQELYESDAYQSAINMLKQFLNVDGLIREELLIDYDISWRNKESSKKGKNENQMILKTFFDLLALYCHDVILKNDAKGPKWYYEAVRNANNTNTYYAKMIMIVNEEKDKVNKFNDLNLVFAKAFYRLEELKNERSL